MPRFRASMSRQDHILRLLLVDDSVDEAERLVSQLRNGGIPVRPSHARTQAELEAQIALGPDLVLFSMECRHITLATAIDAINRDGRDIGSIICGKGDVDPAIVAQAFQSGVNGFAFASQPEHLRAVVRREFAALSSRRTERRLEADLRESQRRCDTLLQSSREPIAYEHEGMHIRANRAWIEAFRIDEGDPIEGVAVLDLIASESIEAFKGLLRGESGDGVSRLPIIARRTDGTTFDALLELSAATYEGEACHQMVLRLPEAQSATDPERLRQQEELRSRDLVTDLFNRKHLLGELERAVDAATSGKTGQVLTLIEIDRYREISAQVGTVNIDLLLRDVGAEIRRHVGANEIAGRLADHVFAILGSSHNTSSKRELAENLCQSLASRQFTIGRQTLQITVSIGIALLTEKIANTSQVLGQAEEALRQAQAEGGNRVNIVDLAAKAKIESSDDDKWLDLLRNALAGNGFVLRYQPVIGLNSAGGEIYEVVLRLDSPKGEIRPAVFLPVAERNGLLADIDRWVIARAIRSAVERERAGHSTRFFVKLSAPSLEDPTLLPWIAQQLADARQPGDTLIFEMPESTVVTHLRSAREFLKGLEAIKSTFALEQFGLGLNSFQLVRQIPVRYLKIDRNYMIGLPGNPENQEKIRDICTQAKHAGKLTIAEFVEDAASMTILFSCGVNFVQGNFLREPERTMSYDFGVG